MWWNGISDESKMRLERPFYHDKVLHFPEKNWVTLTGKNQTLNSLNPEIAIFKNYWVTMYVLFYMF